MSIAVDGPLRHAISGSLSKLDQAYARTVIWHRYSTERLRYSLDTAEWAICKNSSSQQAISIDMMNTDGYWYYSLYIIMVLILLYPCNNSMKQLLWPLLFCYAMTMLYYVMLWHSSVHPAHSAHLPIMARHASVSALEQPGRQYHHMTRYSDTGWIARDAAVLWHSEQSSTHRRL